MANIYFYLPDFALSPLDMANLTTDWPGFSEGRYCWTLKTYLCLMRAGFQCKLVHSMPDAGIIISHRAFLSDDFCPNVKQLLVCIKADWGRHPYAQIHIVQNRHEGFSRVYRYFMPGKSYFMTHWLQSGIKPRAGDRENLVKNIAYIGREVNLADELKTQDWHDRLSDLGFNWLPVFNPLLWHDFTEIDVVVSAREFPARPNAGKPASKLVNAWHAGVPGCFTPETAVMDERISEIDFLPVNSPEEIISALVKLRDQPEFYQAMSGNCKIRALEYSEQRITAAWGKLISETLQNDYRLYAKNPLRHYWFKLARKLLSIWLAAKVVK